MATVIDELEIKVNSNGLDALLGTMDKLAKQFEKVGAMSKGFSNATAGVVRSTQAIGKSTEGATRGANKFFASIVRVAKYRLIRMALRSVTKAIKEGAEHFYNFSKASGESLYGFAAAMDSIKGGALTLKAQLGSAFAALLSALAPIINSLISLIIKLANAMSMVFAALGGGSKWYKAADGADALANSVGGAGGAAKEALRYLAPFDELNVLPKDSGGGGGGGGGSDPFGDMGYTEQDIPEWLQNFGTSLQISINDVFFNWDDLTPEQIAEKAIVGVTGLLGGITGFILGGGTVTGALIGVGIGILINSLVFNHDGNIDSNEIATLVVGALGAGVGGIFGAMIGGPAGALIGISLGALLTITITSLNLIDAIGDWKQKYIDEHPDTALANWFKGEQEVNAVIKANADVQFEQHESNVGIIKGIWEWIASGHQPIDGVCTLNVETNVTGDGDAKSIFDAIFGDNHNSFSDVQEEINRTVSIGVEVEREGWTTITDWIKDAAQWGSDVVQKGVAIVKSGWSTVTDWVKDAAQWGQGILEKGIGLLQDGWTSVTQWIKDKFFGGDLEKGIGLFRKDWGYNTVSQWIYHKFWGDNISKGIGLFRQNWGRNTVAQWIYWNYWGDNLNKGIGLAKSGWSTVWNWVKQSAQWGSDIAQKRIELIRHGWDTVYGWIKKAAQWGTDLIQRAIDLKKNGWSTVTSWVQSHLGSGTVSVGVSVHSSSSHVKGGATGGVFSGGVWRDINRYASGGILGTGSQLFWAREAGPELVGTLGSHTAVMNNDQIVASVSSGVARAMSGIRFKISSAATSSGMLDTEALYSVISRAISDNETDTEISLDGDVVYRKMLNRNRLETYRTGNNPMMTMA